MKIKVIGTGGIGLCVLPSLCRFLNYANTRDEITLIDGDSFEEKNRARQEFTSLGNKASVTAEDYRKKFSSLTFRDQPAFISEDNSVQMIRDGDTVFLCVDNHNTRKLVSRRCSELKNVTLISGGNELTDGNVVVYIRRNGKELTPPLDSKYHPEIAKPRDKHPEEVLAARKGCLEVAVSEPQLLLMNNLIAANMLALFYNLSQPEHLDRVLKEPENYAEVYCDLKTVKTAPRTRKL